MRGGKKQKGYTIIEVMIFLAVSSFMFFIATIFINGKQEKAEFRQGVFAINSKLSSTFNDVGNGYYPDASGFAASASPSGCTSPSGNTGQGKKVGCVFLGKVLRFTEHSGKYSVYSVAGLQYKNGIVPGSLTGIPAQVATNFTDSKPVVFDALTQSSKFEWGLNVDKVLSTAPTINAIGIFSTFGSYNNLQLLNSGGQSVIVVPLSVGADSAAQVQLALNGSGSNSLDNIVASTPSPKIILCLSGNTNQYGTLQIGGDGAVTGQRFSLKPKIYNERPAQCI